MLFQLNFSETSAARSGLEYRQREVNERVMTDPSENLNLDIRQLAADLRRLEKRLRVEPDPAADVLMEFRHAVDDARLTAWSVNELITANRASKVRTAALAFVAAERIRRLEQLVRNISGDIEGQAITLPAHKMRSLLDSVTNLQNVLTQCLNQSHKVTTTS